MKTISLKRILVVLAAFFTALLLLITPTVQASADETSVIRYTDVLEDLKRDENFDESKYVAKADDYSLSVIHIAENKARELLIYVYRPSAENENYDCTAKKISISKSIGDEIDYNSYDLTLVSRSGVFDKYRVNGLNLSSKSIRYYSISMISRKSYSKIDDKDSGNLLSEIFGNFIQSIKGYKSYKVAQRWRVISSEGTIRYECEKEDVIEIKNKTVGHLVYKESELNLTKNIALESYFIAFSLDFGIDDLLSAKVTFNTQAYNAVFKLKIKDWKIKSEYTLKYIDEKPIKQTVVLNHDEYGKHEADGLFGKDYKWSKIESILTT